MQEWCSLSIIESSLLSVLLSATDVSDSSSMPTRASFSPVVQHPSSLCCLHNIQYHSIEKDTGHDRLVEHKQEFATDIEGPQPPKEIKSALAFLVKCISIGRPVEFIVQM